MSRSHRAKHKPRSSRQQPQLTEDEAVESASQEEALSPTRDGIIQERHLMVFQQVSDAMARYEELTRAMPSSLFMVKMQERLAVYDDALEKLNDAFDRATTNETPLRANEAGEVFNNVVALLEEFASYRFPQQIPHNIQTTQLAKAAYRTRFVGFENALLSAHDTLQELGVNPNAYQELVKLHNRQPKSRRGERT